MHFLLFKDINPKQVDSLITRAAELKNGAQSSVLSHKSVVLLFEKPSLRTKLSFWVGAEKLGGNPVYFSSEEIGLGKREPVKDVARVVSGIADMVILRTFVQKTLEEFAEASAVPVINALTDSEHPCQALADVYTITEVLGKVKGRRVAFIGDGNNVATSLAFAVAGCGGDFVIASPEGYELKSDTIEAARHFGRSAGGNVTQVRAPETAAKGSHIIYTDVWVSMGSEEEAELRRRDFAGYQVTPELLDKADPHVHFMHDMPAHPGEEITEGILYDPRSVCFTQAENRLWAQAALMEMLTEAILM